MRKTLIALAAVMAASTAQAVDLAPGVSLDTELKAFHLVDAETNNVTIEPVVNWTPGADGPLTFSLGTLVTVYATDHASGDDIAIMNVFEDGHRPAIDLGFDYDLSESTTVYGDTSWNLNDEDRGEIEVGVSFNF